AAAIIAKAIPVLPDVASRIIFPGSRRPAVRAYSSMYKASRSFTEPPILYHSSFAYMFPSSGQVRCFILTKGVLPIKSVMLSATIMLNHVLSNNLQQHAEPVLIDA